LEFLTAVRDDRDSNQRRISCLRRRDPDALAEAVHEHARPLLRAARTLGFAESEAEDMVQDVFRTFLERLDNFEGQSQLRKWLSGILHRKALERHRAAAMDDRVDPIDEVFESRGQSP
jgi:RNA polymerase sigma-70 factor (ECF subfamily)